MKKTLLVLGITFSLLMAQQSHAQTINTQDKASLIASITAQLQKLQAIMIILNTPLDQIHQQINTIDQQRTALLAQKEGMAIGSQVQSLVHQGASQNQVINLVNQNIKAVADVDSRIADLNIQEQVLNDDLNLKIQYQVQS